MTFPVADLIFAFCSAVSLIRTSFAIASSLSVFLGRFGHRKSAARPREYPRGSEAAPFAGKAGGRCEADSGADDFFNRRLTDSTA
jgi:hypothetical protein